MLSVERVEEEPPDEELVQHPITVAVDREYRNRHRSIAEAMYEHGL
jgi:hypothetical protein